MYAIKFVGVRGSVSGRMSVLFLPLICVVIVGLVPIINLDTLCCMGGCVMFDNVCVFSVCQVLPLMF